MTGQREIIEIPARAPEAQGRPEQKLRVAAYCRVSTNQEAQQNSYQTQRAYYLEKIASNPDWVIDTNRAASPLMTNALAAADSVLIPITPEFYATEGLADMITTVLKSKRRLNPHIAFEGILFTISDMRTNLYKTAWAEVGEAFQGDIPIFHTVIPRTVQVGEAIKRGLTVLQYASNSSASMAYRALAEEVIANAGSQSAADPASEYAEGIGRAS